MKTIGILGGMGPEATLLLYRLIISHTEAKCDQEHIPTLIYSNTEIPDRTQAILHQGRDPLPYLVRSGKILRKGGADIIGMPCNTAHYYFDSLVRAVKGDFVNMVELVYREILKNHRGKKIMIFATEGTIKTGIYNFCRRNRDLSIMAPKPEDQQVITEMIYGQIKRGQQPIDLEAYQELLYRLEEEGFETLILGCTELSHLHNMFKFPVNMEFINALDLLARELVKRAKA